MIFVAAFLAGMIFALAVIAAWALAAANTVTDREARACPVCGGEPLDGETRTDAQEAGWAHFDPAEHRTVPHMRIVFDHDEGEIHEEPPHRPFPR